MTHLLYSLFSRLCMLLLSTACLTLASGCLRLLEEPEAEVQVDHFWPPDSGAQTEPAPALQQGEPCVPGSAPLFARCSDGLSCVQGSCQKPGCSEDADCGYYTCDDFTRTCETRCSPFSTGDCGPGAVCRGTSCVDGGCNQQNAPETCGGFACHAGVCRASCSSDGDCQPEHRCEFGSCRPTCDSPYAASCAPFACDVSYGSCKTSCLEDSQCAGGYVCRSSQCVRNPDGQSCAAQTASAACGKRRCFEPPGVCAGPCSGDQDCADGARCAPTRCLGDLISCYPLLNECQTACSSSRDKACGAYRCNLTYSTCETGCSETLPCAPGQRCNAQQKCEPAPATRACSSDVQCGTSACDLARGICIDTCAGNADCAAGAICHEQTCRPVCNAQNAASVCQGFGCETSYVPAFCRTSCTVPKDCARGYSCNAGSCQLNQACAALYDCPGPYLCDTSSGRCLSWCSADQDCRSSYGCKTDGTCWDL